MEETSLSSIGLWRAQTPQLFRYGLLRKGLENKTSRRPDEAEARRRVDRHRRRASPQGESSNIKVTFAEDLVLAEMILGRKKPVPL